MKSFLYTGNPAKASPLPGADRLPYLPDPGLIDAVNVALILRKPLLLTGEPGTGKTCLAASVAAELDLGRPLRLQTKSTSTARDLFYYYDSIRYFHAAQTQRSSVGAAQFITIQALGEAIIRTMDPAEVHAALADFEHVLPQRSVVLIDEVDKAPRDFPNDILHEVEDLCFQIPELEALEFHASDDPNLQPILVFTSNSEKNLPDAFLRRCVYYHIPFPNKARLQRIVEAHRGSLVAQGNPRLAAIIDFFTRFRDPNVPIRKRPATAELLDLVQTLAELGDVPFTENATPNLDEQLLRKALPALIKTIEDLQPGRAIINEWISDRTKSISGAAVTPSPTGARD
jgi:MoxR-like ATPase